MDKKEKKALMRIMMAMRMANKGKPKEESPKKSERRDSPRIES